MELKKFTTRYTYVCVDGQRSGNYSRFINHGADEVANCAYQTFDTSKGVRLGVFAKRNISPGEELLVFYGPGATFSGCGNTPGSSVSTRSEREIMNDFLSGLSSPVKSLKALFDDQPDALNEISSEAIQELLNDDSWLDL